MQVEYGRELSGEFLPQPLGYAGLGQLAGFPVQGFIGQQSSLRQQIGEVGGVFVIELQLQLGDDSLLPNNSAGL